MALLSRGARGRDSLMAITLEPAIHRLTRRALLIAGILAALPARAQDSPAQSLLVCAAASMSNVLEELGAAYRTATGVDVKLSVAASSALARQIESGAPADVFVSADQDWMDYLEGRGLIDAASRRDVAGNRLVLVEDAGGRRQLGITQGFDLRQALGGQRLAIADPDSVPAGRYARAALTSLGVWATVEDRLVRAENVRSALAFVARGEAPLGIVYATDARIEPKVRVVDVFPEASHSPIRYPVALTRSARPAARGFIEYLSGADARAAFQRYGFTAAH